MVRLPPLECCPACGAAVGRWSCVSDYWHCDHGHVIYRGPEKEHDPLPSNGIAYKIGVD